MPLVTEIDYWIKQADEDLDCFVNIEKVRKIFKTIADQNLLRYYELPNREGVVAYMVGDNFLGADCVMELFMYIKPHARGNVRLFKKLINHLELVAKTEHCVSVKIASNISYRDEKVLKVLSRWGYNTDSVIKKI